MNTYTEQIRSILKEDTANRIQGEPRTAMLLDFSKAEHLNCIFAQYGGEENLKKRYPDFYQAILNTKRVHKVTTPEKYLKQEAGLNDSIYIYDMAYSDQKGYCYGAATLTADTARLYISLSLYDGETCIASVSDFFHNTSRATLECISSARALQESHLKAILHVTWESQDSDSLTSAALEMTQVIASIDPITEVIISHPRLNPGSLPTPIPDDGVTSWTMDCINEETNRNAQEFINICYARNPLSGERCDYQYPEGLKNGQQNIYLDVRGEVKLDSNWEYDKLIYADIGFDIKGGNAYHQLPLTEKYIQKTGSGFTYAFPTNWHTPIPGGKLAGNELAYMSVKITFRCKGSNEDFVVFIKSYVTQNRGVTHSVTMPSLKLNWGCVAGETKVVMAGGQQKMIKDVQIAERVVTGNGEMAVVNDIMRGQENIIWNVKAFGKEIIKVTGAHPFQTKAGMKMAEDLIETDELLMGDGSYALIEYRFEQYYGDMVYNLELGDAKSFIGNGYVIGDNAQQGDCMRAADEKNKRSVSNEILAEIAELKKEFSK